MTRPAPLIVIVLAVAACSSHSSRSAERRPTTASAIVVKVEPAKLPDQLEANQCFAAVRGFAIVAEAEGPTTICGDLAAKYLHGLHRLSWTPPLLDNPDGISQCVVEFLTTRLVVMRTTTNDALGDWAYDVADRMCSELREEGWKNADRGP
jgi:hypothetical protein